MNCQRVNNDWYSLLCREIAQALDENEDHYSLLVGQACIHRNIHEVRLDRYGGYRSAMEC